jgi:hypothetical protein
LAKLAIGVDLESSDTRATSSSEVSYGVAIRALDLLTEFELLVHVESVLALALSSLEVSNSVLVLASEISADRIVFHEVSEPLLACAFSVKEFSTLFASLANIVDTVDTMLWALTVHLNSESLDTPRFASRVLEVIEELNFHDISLVLNGLLELPDSVLGRHTAKLFTLERIDVQESSNLSSVDLYENFIIIKSGILSSERIKSVDLSSDGSGLMVRKEELLLDTGSVSERVESSKESNITTVSCDSSRSNLVDLEFLSEIFLLGIRFLSVLFHIENGELIILGFFSEFFLDDFRGRSAIFGSFISPKSELFLALASSVVDNCVLVNARQTSVRVGWFACLASGAAQAN